MVVDTLHARLTARRVISRGRRAIVWSAGLALLLGAACATGPKRPPAGLQDPDRFLWERGTEALNDRKWLTSREYFRQLVDSYPQSLYRADAKLGIGDTFLGEGTAEAKVLAINEYREFLSFYPIHARAPYAQYKLGMSYYYQMHGSDRDQTETAEAITELTAFMQRYPNDPLAPEVRTRLREARDRYSDAAYNIGVFYLRTYKFPPAAVDRFTEILKTDPEYTRRDGVYFYLAQALIRLGRPAEALPHLDRLLKEFEQSEYLIEAQTLMTTLQAEAAKKVDAAANPPK